jgi:large subunit ribosomal protein L19
MRMGISHRFRGFSQRISAYPRAHDRGRARILDDEEEHEFRLQNQCLRMRVCARSGAGWYELMNRIIDSINKEQEKDDLAPFSVGDSVRVHTRVVEGDKERIQIFTGVVIGRKGRGLNETFTVRRISYGEGVERVFPLHSPRIAKVEVEQQGRARRAKLNYLRGRKGKEATAVRE